MKELIKLDKDNGTKLSGIRPKKNATKSSNMASWMRLKQDTAHMRFIQILLLSQIPAFQIHKGVDKNLPPVDHNFSFTKIGTVPSGSS